jgi:hypothetical protein
MALDALQAAQGIRDYGLMTAAESREILARGPRKLHRARGFLYVSDRNTGRLWTVLSDQYPPPARFRPVWAIVGEPADWYSNGHVDLWTYEEALALTRLAPVGGDG